MISETSARIRRVDLRVLDPRLDPFQVRIECFGRRESPDPRGYFERRFDAVVKAVPIAKDGFPIDGLQNFLRRQTLDDPAGGNGRPNFDGVLNRIEKQKSLEECDFVGRATQRRQLHQLGLVGQGLLRRRPAVLENDRVGAVGHAVDRDADEHLD